jgi:hypothetical protein
MPCTQNSGTTKGILIAYQPTDTGDRPLAAGTAYWESPNIRLALAAEVGPLRDHPENWDPPHAPFNGQVTVGSSYALLVRIRNTDQDQARTFLHLEG